MTSRAKVNTSALVRSSTLHTPAASLERSYAEDYGTIIENVDGIDDFYAVLRAQADFLLQNSGIALHPLALPFQQLQKTHKRELDIFRPDEQRHARPAKLHILFPYVPQYGYLHELEAHIGLPLRMTIGIEQPHGNVDADEYSVGYTNLWVAKDHTTPNEGSLRVLKDTVAHPAVVDDQGAKEFFDRSMRSRQAATFALQQTLEHLS